MLLELQQLTQRPQWYEPICFVDRPDSYHQQPLFGSQFSLLTSDGINEFRDSFSGRNIVNRYCNTYFEINRYSTECAWNST